MEDDVRCPQCNSENVLFSKKRQLYICEDCSHEFKISATSRRRVFISYGHDEHAALALRLKKDLEVLGYEAWFDIEKIKGGSDWEGYIEDGLEWVSEYPGEGRFVLLMTPYSVRRPDGYCLNELARALQRRLRIIPVMLLDTEPPVSIKRMQYLDMRGCESDGVLYREKLKLLVITLESDKEPGSDEQVTLAVPREYVRTDTSATRNANFKRVYIGYGNEEHASLAVQLKKDLESKGIEVWFDLERIRKGLDHEAYAEDGLSWAAENPGEGKFLLLMTPYSVRRPDGHCLNEISKAILKKLPIVPVMVAWCEPPLSICRTQWLDMQDCVPIERKMEKYWIKLEMLVEVLNSDRLDNEGIQSRLLHALEPLAFDADISQHVAKFGGRKWVLDMVERWLVDPDANRILWIAGAPGIGKSAIAAWLCYHRPEVAAFHLCRQDEGIGSDARRCIQSIAYQMSTQMPEYQARLNGLDLEWIVDHTDTKALFDALIVKPLSGIEHPGSRPVLIVIDSLDESGRGENELASCISSEFTRTPPWLRMLITSRPEPEILRALPGIEPYVLDAVSAENENDIRAYVRGALQLKFRCTASLERAVDAIVARSEGSMLYVDCVCEEISQGRLSLDRPGEFPKGLGGVYAKYFSRQFSSIEEYKSNYRPVLEVIAAAREPIHVELIASILGKNINEISDLCHSIGSLFPIIDGKVKPFHRSLIEWLIYMDRAGQYFVSTSKGHMKISDYGMKEYAEKKLSPYMLAYLPLHLMKVERWNDLKTILYDFSYIEQAKDMGIDLIADCWSALEAHTDASMIDAYRPMIEAPAAYGSGSVWRLMSLLLKKKKTEQALILMNYLVSKDIEIAEMPVDNLGSLKIMSKR